jgi:hypothetical protein
MTHLTEARGTGNNATISTSAPYLTLHEVLRMGIRRAAGRKDIAAAQSTWDSEGGANEAEE